MAISLADKIADFKEQYLVSETEFYSSNPQRELELTALLGRLGYHNELDVEHMMKCRLHVPAVYRMWKEGRAEVFSRGNLFQNIGADNNFPQFTYLSFSSQQEFEKFDIEYGKLACLEEELELEMCKKADKSISPSSLMVALGLAGMGVLTHCINPDPVIKEYVIPVSFGTAVL
jgi:hypothetical protein